MQLEPLPETPTEETAPAEETPTPDESTSDGEGNGDEQPTEEPALAGDESTDTGATE